MRRDAALRLRAQHPAQHLAEPVRLALVDDERVHLGVRSRSIAPMPTSVSTPSTARTRRHPPADGS